MESVHHFVEMNVSADAIRLVSKRDDGSVVERCGLVKAKGDWDCDPAPPVAAGTPVAAPEPIRPASSKFACDVAGVGLAPRSSLVPFAALAFFALAFARRRRLE